MKYFSDLNPYRPLFTLAAPLPPPPDYSPGVIWLARQYPVRTATVQELYDFLHGDLATVRDFLDAGICDVQDLRDLAWALERAVKSGTASTGDR